MLSSAFGTKLEADKTICQRKEGVGSAPFDKKHSLNASSKDGKAFFSSGKITSSHKNPTAQSLKRCFNWVNS
jgi:hypothetical protein